MHFIAGYHQRSFLKIIFRRYTGHMFSGKEPLVFWLRRTSDIVIVDAVIPVRVLIVI